MLCFRDIKGSFMKHNDLWPHQARQKIESIQEYEDILKGSLSYFVYRCFCSNAICFLKILKFSKTACKRIYVKIS